LETGSRHTFMTNREYLVDLRGHKFGRLVVLRRTRKCGLLMWLCKCSCGNYHKVTTRDLHRGCTRSCGCWHEEVMRRRKASDTDIILSRMLATYKDRASRRNHTWSLSKKQFNGICLKACRYCGTTGPSGIDRINNSKGYVKGNCAPCCKWCNYAKRDRALKQFKCWIKTLHMHMFGGLCPIR
jgi:hypothetical protein